MRGVDSVRSEEDLKMVSSFMKEAVADSYKILEKKKDYLVQQKKKIPSKNTPERRPEFRQPTRPRVVTNERRHGNYKNFIKKV